METTIPYLRNAWYVAALAPEVTRTPLARRLLDIPLQWLAPGHGFLIDEPHAVVSKTIAHRLGLNQTYRELQELSFKHLQPWRHGALSKAVLRARGYRRDIVERIQRSAQVAALRCSIVGPRAWLRELSALQTGKGGR